MSLGHIAVFVHHSCPAGGWHFKVSLHLIAMAREQRRHYAFAKRAVQMLAILPLLTSRLREGTGEFIKTSLPIRGSTRAQDGAVGAGQLCCLLQASYFISSSDTQIEILYFWRLQSSVDNCLSILFNC